MLSDVQQSCGQPEIALFSCLGAKVVTVQCAARPAAGEVAQEGTAAATQAALPTGMLACSLLSACMILLTCGKVRPPAHLILTLHWQQARTAIRCKS